MQQVVRIYATQRYRLWPDSDWRTEYVQTDYYERQGYNGSRTIINNAYVYLVPTDYRRYNTLKSLYRWYKWDGYGKWHAGDVYQDVQPLAVGQWKFVDYAWGSNPEQAAIYHAYSNLRSNLCNYAMLTKDLYDGLKMSQDYFDRLARAAPYIKRKQFKKAFNAFFGTSQKRKAAANTWLEFQWGVKPTISAVQETLKRATTDDARIIRVTAGAESQEWLINDGSSWYFSGHLVKTSSCRCFRYFKNIYQLEAAAFNPIQPAFDAIPWSFLVGWFIPIEEYLLQFGYVPFWSETVGCDSVITRTEGHFDYIRNQYDMSRPFGDYGDSEWIPLGRVNSCLEFRRTQASGVSLPLTFMEMLDRGKINMSVNRLVSSVALVTQRLK
jgi:hypothetical protein